MSSQGAIQFGTIENGLFNLNADINKNYYTFTNSGGWIFLTASLVVILFVILSIMNAYQYFKISQKAEDNQVDFVSKGQSTAYGIVNSILGVIFVGFAIYLVYKTFTVKDMAYKLDKETLL